MNLHGFLISAPQSGSGKTTISLAIMAAFVKRGVTVFPFKCGPDFIDPGYHALITGRPSVNLDAWMCQAEFVSETFKSFCDNRGNPLQSTRSVAVIEGAMGLFDGLGAAGKEGSSAQIASITGAPVILVVNARGMATSAAALVNGFARFDPQITLAGVIFNNVGSDSHADLLKEEVSTYCPGILCFGCIPRDESIGIASRHLGLVTADDNQLSVGFIDKLADTAIRYLDLDKLVELKIHSSTPLCNDESVMPAISAKRIEHTPGHSNRGQSGFSPVRIAVARDAAFCFMYQDNLRLLQEAGAEIIFFSPLKDLALPSDVRGIYLPGGYPELYAEELSTNKKMIEAIQAAVASDMPVYAECGGFIYLTQGVDASENQPEADFAGIYPVRTRMLQSRKALGYRQVDMTEKVIIGASGETVRGHEFHYSEIGEMPDNIERCYKVSRQDSQLGLDGYRVRNCLASYIHIHFGSNIGIAPAFVVSCLKYQSSIQADFI